MFDLFSIMDLNKSGDLKRLQEKWWRPCDKQNNDANESITLDNIGGAFILVGVGVLVGISLQLLENLTSDNNKKIKKEHINKDVFSKEHFANDHNKNKNIQNIAYF